MVDMAWSSSALRRRTCALLAAVFSVVVAGCTTSPVFEQPTASGPAVGVQYHGLWSDWSDADREGVLDRMSAAGVGWLRLDVGWEALEERGPGRRSDWYVERLDRAVEGARARRMQVLVTLWTTPGWANGDRGRTVPPDDPGQYARVATWLADRYRGRVAAWEVWNEPNSSDFFTGDAAAYVRLLKAAAPGFHAGDPDARVVLGGPSYNDTDWLEQVYAAGAAGSFDVLATHPYLGPSDAPPETPDDGSPWTLLHVTRVQQLMRDNGDGDLPIWFTEFGWSTHGNTDATQPWQRGVSPSTQGEYLVRTLDLLRSRFPQVSHVFWYAARDRVDSDVHTNGYGLLTYDLEPKPAYRALRAYLAL
jgi:polysaccharide biosynthesis protein PslG